MKQQSTPSFPFSFPFPAQSWLPPLTQTALTRTLEDLSRITEMNAIYARLPEERQGTAFFTEALRALQISVSADAEELAHIPAEGPVVLVANHPFGMIEGVLLGYLVAQIRPDFKFLSNQMINMIPELREFNISVDVFGGPDAARFNMAPLRQTLRWLRDGHVLITFPAGEVAHLRLPRVSERESPWHPNMAGIIRHAKAPVLPLYIDGTNSPLFHAAGLVHPLLRTFLLPREMLNKQHQTIHINIGSCIAPARLATLPTDEEMIAYLQMRSHLLQQPRVTALPAPPKPTTAPAPIARPDSIETLAAEVESLDADALLVENGEFQVFIAPADRIPHALFELGRQREVAFRGVGEGTGKAVDLDQFDEDYLHLFLWNRAAREIAGGYRLCLMDKMLATKGMKGLYTSTLFRFDESLITDIGPTLELGRSFVRPDYQRSFAPLLLLWRGIGQFVVRNPQYRHLFGPVSISNSYTTMSRQLMVAFLQANHLLPEMAVRVKPRRPMRWTRMTDISPRKCARQVADLDELVQVVSDVEGGRMGIPILLKQYLKLGGRLLGFNVDPDFGDVVDGLILVDLVQTDLRILDKYLGKMGLAAFRRYYGLQGEETEREETEPLLAKISS